MTDKPIDLVQITRTRRVARDEFFPAINAMYEQIWMMLMPAQFDPAELTVKRARNVVTKKDAPVPDCVKCGVCCAAMLCVGVRPSEETKLSPEIFWDVTRDDAEDSPVVDRYLRREPERFMCAQLNVSGDGRTTCNIYENRPKMCRDFDAGSDKCHALRRAYGVDPFLSSEEMYFAKERLAARPPRFDVAVTIREAKFEPTDDGRLRVDAYLMDGSTREIHSFDPSAVTFMQFEFDSLTLDEAAALIAERESK